MNSPGIPQFVKKCKTFLLDVDSIDIFMED